MNGKGTTIAVVGNPNCGKTTLFNALTGSDQRVGNWPGVTVEKKEGLLKFGKEKVTLVDLPGIYALFASSEDERVARDYILSGEPGLVVDIVDATNLERNLFLTTQLLDLQLPLIVVVNMVDLAKARGVSIDYEALSDRLGCPVVGTVASDKHEAAKAVGAIEKAWKAKRKPTTLVEAPYQAERFAKDWRERLSAVAQKLGTNGRWLALKLLERDAWAIEQVVSAGVATEAEIEAAIAEVEKLLKDSADVALAEARYAFIQMVASKSLKHAGHKRTATEVIDKVVLNRWLGIPVFLLVMYLLFWITINVGGAFIDFFDGVGATIFVDGFGSLLERLSAPAWLRVILANGIGGGLQTVITFIPQIFVMFFLLSLLEDSGYMARAAFVMDRFMRWVGLPGKSFVPMLVGFGCNVPAIMATRTLENKRDRYLTIFMNPFMSCGARLPVYALFGAAFFGAAAGTMVFSLYLVGILVAIATGLILKRTLFKGEASFFVMELPPYHKPMMGNVLRYSGRRLMAFMTRAKYIVPIVTVLAVLNSLGIDGSFGNEDSPKSVLSQAGRAITPVFEPMGVEKENWPASVGILTGVLAKEAVIGTLSSLYSQNAAADKEASAAIEETPVADNKGFHFWDGIVAALATIPENLVGIGGSFDDPLGAGVVSGDQEAVAEEVGADTSVYAGLRANFTGGPFQAYAYLLFVLLYLPCVAAFGAMTKEMGLKYTLIATAYIAVTSWSAATLFYQITLGHNIFWIIFAVVLVAAMIFVLRALGKQVEEESSGLSVKEAAA
ncbi:MAG: Fe(2+) transporter permease subunit FeoB [Rectinema sp.]|jgi:ferrous iron transport protein B